MRKSLRPSFDELKGMKWFEEKYMDGTEWEAEREKRKIEGRKGRMQEWCEMAEKGELENVTNDFGEFVIFLNLCSERMRQLTRINPRTDR
jgi:hypothetical protein